MAKTAFDYGQADIAAFKQGAQNGSIKFDPQAVTDVVRVYDTLIKGLTDELNRIKRVTNQTGFGGFPSTQQLAAGFAGKAEQFVAVLGLFIEGAIRLQEAYLIAGNRIQEADAKNTQALQFAAQNLGTEGAKQ
ncbi:hypothetical protein [Nocardia sp. bgisy118]|uniref:hypothetical protein n=1 Tax=Nocardia sp. bgisy118 TaxID=3413786 RepID=UPI003F4A0D0D